MWACASSSASFVSSVLRTRAGAVHPAGAGDSLPHRWRERTPSTSAATAATRSPLARTVPGLRRVEHARGGGRCRSRPPRRGAAGGAAARPVRLADVRSERLPRLPTRHRGVRPRARRRAGPRLARPARRLARHRQVDAHRDGARAISPAAGAPRSTCRARSRPRRSACAPSASARRRCRSRSSRRPTSPRVLATMEAERPDVLRHRFGADAARRGAHRRARLGGAGPRGRLEDHGRREGDRHGGAARRARHEGGRARRPARARAPRRLRAAVRGRARAHVPDRPRAEEPVRLHERDRGVRDALRRPGRGARRQRALRGGGDGQARLGRARLDGGHAAAAGRGAGARVAERARAAPPRVHGDRPQPPRARARRARPSRRRGRRHGGRVRQRRGRHPDRRAGRGPRGRAGGRQRGEGRAAAGLAARVLRRGRADGRAAHRRARRAPAGGGGEVRPARRHQPRACADAAGGAADGAAPGAEGDRVKAA